MPATVPSQIAIFWDYENCRPPSNLSGNKVVENIRRLVQGSGIVTIFKAYVDISLECANPRSVVLHSDLQSSGVTLVHCPHNGKKDVADKMMIVDMLAFALDKPPPATIVIITGDRDFAYAAATLKLRGYQIIVIAPPYIGHASLKMQADSLFDWQEDIIGVNNPEVTSNFSDFVRPIPLSREATPSRDAKPTLLNPKGGSTASLSANLQKPIDSSPVPPNESIASAITGYWHNTRKPSSFLSDRRVVSFQPDRDEPLSQSITEDGQDWQTFSKSMKLSKHIDASSTSANAGSRELQPLEGLTGQHEVGAAVDTALNASADVDHLSKGTTSSFPFSSQPLSTSFSSVPAFSFGSFPEAPLLTRTGRSPRLDPPSECSGHPKRGSLSSLDALEVNSDEDAEDRCICTICTRSSEVRPNALAESVKIAAEQSGVDLGFLTSEQLPHPHLAEFSTEARSEQIFSAESQHEANCESSTGSPSSISSEISSTNTMPSTSLSFGSQDSRKTPAFAAMFRFRTLIDVFVDQRALNGTTRIRSATVASEMRKRDPKVYENAGVLRMKQYIEEARKANVIVTPGLDNEGDCWIEINTALYPNATRNAAPTAPAVSPSAAPAQYSQAPLKTAAPIAEAIFKPLINRLRMETPSHRLLYSMLGMFFRAEHPNLYERANVTGLSQFLQQAETQGIVRTGGINTPGRQWAELTLAYRNG